MQAMALGRSVRTSAYVLRSALVVWREESSRRLQSCQLWRELQEVGFGDQLNPIHRPLVCLAERGANGGLQVLFSLLYLDPNISAVVFCFIFLFSHHVLQLNVVYRPSLATTAYYDPPSTS